ncbi:hypothetical protein EUTSA_v10027164mg, partial [Eutrema salsugineum]
MENASLFSPANPHFFQPLLTGSHSHLSIPVKFFSKHIEGKYEGKTVTLRSDASEKTWKVKMEGQRLTEGWKEFVRAHDLRIGDFVVFRHEGDMLFHVTALGPSCCEIQYAPSGSRDEDKEETSETGSETSDKEVEPNLSGTSNHSSSDLTCFRQFVTASNLSRDTVGVPSAFAKRNGLNKGSQEIILMNEEGRSWPSQQKTLVDYRIVIVRGWTSFCTANKLEAGDSCTFKLLQNANTPVFRLCSRTKHLPVSFTRANGLIKPEKVILVDKNRAEWSMNLKVEKGSGTMYIMSGKHWKRFCAVNEVGAGESLTLELIRGGKLHNNYLCFQMEQSPFDAQARTHKRARVQRWISQETRPKHEIREKAAEEGEPFRRTRASNNANQGNLENTHPCSVSDLVPKVKQSVADTLTSIRLFREELEKMEQKLEDSLQEIDNL